MSHSPGDAPRDPGTEVIDMATEKQRAAARKNIKKAQSVAAEKRTIAHLPKSTRSALGKQGAKSRKG